mgnify:CR=1 FL=1
MRRTITESCRDFKVIDSEVVFAGIIIMSVTIFISDEFLSDFFGTVIISVLVELNLKLLKLELEFLDVASFHVELVNNRASLEISRFFISFLICKQLA